MTRFIPNNLVELSIGSPGTELGGELLKLILSRSGIGHLHFLSQPATRLGGVVLHDSHLTNARLKAS